jgi:hypothetical protein
MVPFDSRTVAMRLGGVLVAPAGSAVGREDRCEVDAESFFPFEVRLIAVLRRVLVRGAVDTAASSSQTVESSSSFFSFVDFVRLKLDLLKLEFSTSTRSSSLAFRFPLTIDAAFSPLSTSLPFVVRDRCPSTLVRPSNLLSTPSSLSLLSLACSSSLESKSSLAMSDFDLLPSETCREREVDGTELRFAYVFERFGRRLKGEVAIRLGFQINL